MNYIKEINAFYDWLETNSISDSSIALWHALMHINNKAGWVREFAVAISTLEAKTGLKKDAIFRARLRLQQLGRIEFKSRTGQMSALYKIICFDAESNSNGNSNNGNKHNDNSKINMENICVVLNDTKCDTNRDTNRNTNRAQTATQTASITKLNKTKLNNIVVSNNAVSNNAVNITVSNNTASNNNLVNYGAANKFSDDEAVLQKIQKIFDQNIHPMTPVEMTDILDWLNRGFESDVIIAAINIAVRENRRFMRYINGILTNWNKLGLKTADAVDAHNREWQERYKPKAWIVTEGDGANGANRANIERESYGAGIGFKV